MEFPPPEKHSRAAPTGFRPQVKRIGALVVRARLLLSSYVALDLILVARVHPLWPRAACGALALLGLVDAGHLLCLSKGTRAVPRKVARASEAGGEVTGYLATYLLPLLAAPSPSAGDLVAYGIYAALVVIVSLRSDLVQINPTLYLFGLKVSDVTFQDGGTAYVVSKGRIPENQALKVTKLAGVLVSQ
jgi:hypothetical protein